MACVLVSKRGTDGETIRETLDQVNLISPLSGSCGGYVILHCPQSLLWQSMSNIQLLHFNPSFMFTPPFRVKKSRHIFSHWYDLGTRSRVSALNSLVWFISVKSWLPPRLLLWISSLSSRIWLMIPNCTFFFKQKQEIMHYARDTWKKKRKKYLNYVKAHAAFHSNQRAGREIKSCIP